MGGSLPNDVYRRLDGMHLRVHIAMRGGQLCELRLQAIELGGQRRQRAIAFRRGACGPI